VFSRTQLLPAIVFVTLLRCVLMPLLHPIALQIQEGRCVSMRGLRKVYDNGKVAVEGLDLDLFEGQISVLLGQNGAGTYTYI
jgi:ABC-type transport system involved in cytochrome bd biosynthesis fused ATPase/permease subunit